MKINGRVYCNFVDQYKEKSTKKLRGIMLLRLQSWIFSKEINGHVFFDGNPNIAGLKRRLKRVELRQWQSLIFSLFSVSADDVYRNFYCKNVPKWLTQCQIQQLLSRLPLFISLFDKPNAKNYKTYAKYSKNDSEEQWQVLEKVTRETNGKNIFAKVAENFSNKFINFFFMSHISFPFWLQK